MIGYADVIAFVKSIGRLEPYRKDDEDKNKLRLIITDDKLVYLLLSILNIDCVNTD